MEDQVSKNKFDYASITVDNQVSTKNVIVEDFDQNYSNMSESVEIS